MAAGLPPPSPQPLPALEPPPALESAPDSTLVRPLQPSQAAKEAGCCCEEWLCRGQAAQPVVARPGFPRSPGAPCTGTAIAWAGCYVVEESSPRRARHRGRPDDGGGGRHLGGHSCSGRCAEAASCAPGPARARCSADREALCPGGGPGPGRVQWTQPARGLRDFGCRDWRQHSQDHGDAAAQDVLAAYVRRVDLFKDHAGAAFL
jgi:hypothetical protein